MSKSREAFRTISEVADWLDTQPHVLRFWESKFSQIKPVKRAGGRRYYRPSDMALLGGIKKLLHEDGITIKGVQKILKERGVKYVSSLVSSPDSGAPMSIEVPEEDPTFDANVVQLPRKKKQQKKRQVEDAQVIVPEEPPVVDENQLGLPFAGDAPAEDPQVIEPETMVAAADVAQAEPEERAPPTDPAQDMPEVETADQAPSPVPVEITALPSVPMTELRGLAAQLAAGDGSKGDLASLLKRLEAFHESLTTRPHN